MTAAAKQSTGTRARHALAAVERACARAAGYALTGAIIAVVYFFTVAAVALRFHYMSDGDAESDFFGAYVLQARAFLSGHVVIDSYRGPVYPMVLGIFSAFFRPAGAGLFEAGIVLSSAAAAIVVYLNHRVVRLVTTPGIALAATVLLVVNPVFFRYSYTCGTDMFFVALAMTAVVLTLGVESPRRATLRAAALGAVLALVYLTRYNGVVFVVAAAIAIVVFDVWRAGMRARVVAALVMVAVFGALIAPWGLYCRAQKGSFFYSLNYMNVAYSLLPAGSNAEVAAASRFDNVHGLWDVVRTYPGQLIGSMPKRAYYQFVRGMVGVMQWPAGVAVVLGLGSLIVRRPTRRETVYLGFALVFFAALLLVFYSDRFGLFLVPAYAVLAARGLIVLPALAPPRSWVRGVAAGVLAGVVVFSAAWCVHYNHWAMPGGDHRVRNMAEWFAQNVPPDRHGTRVVARKPEFAYFAGLAPVSLPVLESHAALMDYLHKQKADYLFFSYVAAATRPQLGYLLDIKRPPPGLLRVLATRAAVLYHVDPAPADSSSATP